MKKGTIGLAIGIILGILIIGAVAFVALSGGSIKPESIGIFEGEENFTFTCERIGEEQVTGHEYVYTGSEDGNKYSASIIPLIDGNTVCTSGAIDYYTNPTFKKSCKDHSYAYKNFELVANREGPGIYFFWISNDNSVKIFDEEGWGLPGITYWSNSPETLNEINNSFTRMKPLIDYYLEKYPSTKKCPISTN